MASSSAAAIQRSFGAAQFCVGDLDGDGDPDAAMLDARVDYTFYNERSDSSSPDATPEHRSSLATGSRPATTVLDLHPRSDGGLLRLRINPKGRNGK